MPIMRDDHRSLTARLVFSTLTLLCVGIFLHPDSTTAFSINWSRISRLCPGRHVDIRLRAHTKWTFKELPGDFVVIESKVFDALGPQPDPVNVGADGPVAVTDDGPSIEAAQEELLTKLGESQMQELSALANPDGISGVGVTAGESAVGGAASSTNKGCTSLTLTIVPPLTKDERTRLHKNIKARYPTLESKTDTSKGGDKSATYILVFPKGAKSLSSGVSDSSVSVDVNGDRSSSGDGSGEDNSVSAGDSRGSEKKRGPRSVVTQRWDRNKPEYLHFTVTKSMLSTTEMVDRLASLTKLLPTRFSFFGSKDRRAVTMQRLSCWRVEKELLGSAATALAVSSGSKTSTDSNSNSDDEKGLFLPSMRISSIQPGAQPMKLGDLAGNVFAITLRKKPDADRAITSSALASDRGVHTEQTQPATFTPAHSENSVSLRSQLVAADIAQVVSRAASEPFINSFGQQRFGSRLNINTEVGRRLIAGDHRGAVLLLLLAPPTEYEVATGGLRLEDLNEWLDNSSDAVTDNYFSRLAERWREYKDRVLSVINAGNGGIAAFEDPEVPVNEVSDVDGDITEDGDESTNDEQPFVTARAVRDIESRLQCIDDLLSQRPFTYPRSTALVQSKLFQAIKKERESGRNTVIDNIADEASISVDVNDSAMNDGVDLSKVDFARVFSVLPKSLRLLFVNSYQSEVWNEAAVARAQSASKAGYSIISGAVRVGDIALVDHDKRPIDAWRAAEMNVPLSATHVRMWSADPEERERALTESAGSADDGEDKKSERRPKGSKGSKGKSGGKGKRSESSDVQPSARAWYHVLTEEDVASGQFSLESVVLPLPGKDTYNPPEMLDRLVRDGMQALSAGTCVDRSYRVSGAYRHIITNARNVRISSPSLKTADGDDSSTQRTWTAVHPTSTNTQGASPNESSCKFSTKVEELWRSGEMASLLDDIYSGNSSESESGSNCASHRNDRDGDGDGDGVLRLSFSLCSSTYATTYLNHLAKIINNA